MKILIDARFYGLENTGLGRYAINLIENLKKIDQQNQYIILLRKKYYQTLEFPKNWSKVLADYGHYTVSEQVKLSKLISKQNPDLVHFLHFNVPIFYKKPYIVTIHDLLMHKQSGLDTTTLSLPKYMFKRLAYKQVFKSAVLNSKKIIVPSNVIKDELVRYYKINSEKVMVTYEGVDDKVFVQKKGSEMVRSYGLEVPYFIYTGNAYPHKNLKRAIEAIVEVNQKRGKKVMFAIVSSRNVFLQRLEKLVEELGAKKFVKLLNFVPDKDLGILYRNSVAFVYPSTYEGFGLPALEAMSAGTIVIASDIPVFKEVYKSYVSYFNPYDFTDIERSMLMALSILDADRTKVIKNSQNLLKNYSWEQMAKETLQVYNEVFGLR